jgi:hypothetical protein
LITPGSNGVGEAENLTRFWADAAGIERKVVGSEDAETERRPEEERLKPW